MVCIDHRLIWDGLGRQSINSFPQSHAPIKFRWILGRAFLLAEAATIAFLPIHISCFSSNFNPEVPGFSLHAIDLRIGEKFDMRMLTCLHGFGS
jgi:hypothetical protein